MKGGGNSGNLFTAERLEVTIPNPEASATSILFLFCKKSDLMDAGQALKPTPFKIDLKRIYALLVRGGNALPMA